MLKNINKILKVLDTKQKKQFNILIFLMFFAMILETLGIGAIFPLINFFTNDLEALQNNYIINNFLKSFNISNENILNLILISIAIIFVIKNLYMAIYNWLESKFAYKVRMDIGVRLFSKYLNSPYTFHVENNSSNLLTKVEQETSVYGVSLIYLSTLFTEILVITGITLFLFLIRPLETLIVIFIGFFLSVIFYFPVKKIVSRLGKKRHFSHMEKIQNLNQGLGAIKDIIIYKAQKNFINTFKNSSDQLADVAFKANFLGKLPKIWFEITMMIILTSLIFYLSNLQYDTKTIMSTMGIFLVSSVRIIPSINKILASLQHIKFSEPACDSLYSDLYLKNFSKDTATEKKLTFKNEIDFEDVSFFHPKNKKVILKNVNLKIKKNEFVGIIGETGSGKSTLVDLLIGLIQPTNGKIKSDGENINEGMSSWRKKFGYVPQNLYLLDDTILKNIAFGKNNNEISLDNINKSLEQSQLTKFLKNQSNGIKTKVGERGVKISGGEKQRIGISRALYNDPDILVFDEATSALDVETEKKILSILFSLKSKKTIIFITHRKNSLEICDKIFKIENSQVTKIKNFP